MKKVRGKKVSKTADLRFQLERSRLVIRNQQGLIDEFVAEIGQLRTKLDEARQAKVGCVRCNYTAVLDHVDPLNGMVTSVKCWYCRDVMDNYLDKLFVIQKRIIDGCGEIPDGLIY